MAEYVQVYESSIVLEKSAVTLACPIYLATNLFRHESDGLVRPDSATSGDKRRRRHHPEPTMLPMCPAHTISIPGHQLADMIKYIQIFVVRQI